MDLPLTPSPPATSAPNPSPLRPPHDGCRVLGESVECEGGGCHCDGSINCSTTGASRTEKPLPRAPSAIGAPLCVGSLPAEPCRELSHVLVVGMPWSHRPTSRGIAMRCGAITRQQRRKSKSRTSCTSASDGVRGGSPSRRRHHLSERARPSAHLSTAPRLRESEEPTRPGPDLDVEAAVEAASRG